MNGNTVRGRWRRRASISALTVCFLLLAWLVPPLSHRARRLCPLRPDGISESRAIPSFARQTGMSCVVCHTTFPELTPFGRRFKINGFTMTTKPADVSDYSVTTDTHTTRRNLVLSYVSPISYAMEIAYGKWNRPLNDPNAGNGGGPASTAQSQADTFLFPEQFSLFYGGRVTDNVGTWIQLTYDGTAGQVGLDNTEVRYADHSNDREWVWGTYANNSPGMQDAYNTPVAAPFSIPAFNVPSLYGTVGAGGLRAPLAGSLSGQVAGVGGYGFYHDSFYVDVAGYHSNVPGNVALSNPGLVSTGTVGGLVGVAPYVRVAYEKDWGRHSVEIGAMDMNGRLVPGIIPNASMRSPTTDNQFEDTSVDWQYQYIGDDHIFSFLGAYTHERQRNNSLFVGTYYTNNTDYLDRTSLTTQYSYRRHYGGLVNWVNTTGTKDALQNGNDGSPGNQYWAFELDYMPWLNTKFLLQYDVYTVVNGNQSPYFGGNTKPSDNNSFIAGLWMAF